MYFNKTNSIFGQDSLDKEVGRNILTEGLEMRIIPAKTVPGISTFHLIFNRENLQFPVRLKNKTLEYEMESKRLTETK